MKTKPEIRRAEEADIAELTRLLRRSWLRHWAPELPFSAVQSFAAEDPAASYASAMWAEFMVAEADGRVVGMCHVMDDLIASLHVDPAWHGQGIGSRLMEWAEAEVASRFPTARLEVLSFNQQAIAFYERRGWGERRRFCSIECGAEVEAIEMVKDLQG